MQTTDQLLYLLRNEPLSARLTRALAALDRAEQPDAIVKPRMGAFHCQQSKKRCFACLGGLAALDLCAIPDSRAINIGSWDRLAQLAGLPIDEGGRLIGAYENTLDDLRTGDINWALERYNIYADAPIKVDIYPTEVVTYDTDPAQFKLDMQAIVVLLQSHNL